MRRLLLICTGALATLLVVSVATASAAAISLGYCAGGAGYVGSLRGGGSLAPDNDVKAYWEALEAQGYNIISSGWVNYSRIGHSGDPFGDYDIHVLWAFNKASGGTIYRTFHCYRDGYRAGGAYHDGLA